MWRFFKMLGKKYLRKKKLQKRKEGIPWRETLTFYPKDKRPVEDWTDEELAESMTRHIMDRNGPAKDDKGEPILRNGAWVMMLEAAKRLR